jgi:succinate dehydrogenase / fumarate reductase cytochrome b subunit
VPLGVFLVLHLAVNASALRGQDSFAAAVAASHAIPAIGLLTVLLVDLPLLFHGAMGLWAVVARVSLVTPSPYPRPAAILVRVTGVLTLAFLAVHLPGVHAFASGPRPQGGELLTMLSADLSSTSYGVPWRGALYLVGTLAVTGHLALGVWGMLARTPRGSAAVNRRRLAWAAGALGAAMWLVCVDVVVLHATGSRLVGQVAPPPVSHEPCPPPGTSPP